MAESGYPKLAAESWYGLMAPAGVPADAMKKLVPAVQAALADPVFQAAFEETRRDGGGDLAGKIRRAYQGRD